MKLISKVTEFLKGRWRRPRFKIGHVFVFIFLFIITKMFISKRLNRPLDLDSEKSPIKDSPTWIRSAIEDEVQSHFKKSDMEPEMLQNLSFATRGIDTVVISNYHGPFPDSEIKEGRQQELVNYHNYSLQEREEGRVGLGEQGQPARVPDNMKDEEQRLYMLNGFNGLLSDLVPLDRALPDLRHPSCSSYRYFQDLPTVSVIIPFFEEQLSTLQRTVVSVINRSPRHLIKEIILVDDGSTTRADLHAPLDQWVEQHVPLARIVRFHVRQGLIAARMAGAKEATGDIILILDSHCEMMTDWLPPLLNPIAENYRTVVCPLIDIIEWDTFAYTIQDNGAKGGFDWYFFYKRIQLPANEANNLPRPFTNPVMNGGIFAISRKFFWELGGYDPGVVIWGGEQYNLSFKVWQCGGRLLDAPCSRVGHVFRGTTSIKPSPKRHNYLISNYKRIALVWMDEYIEALYRRAPAMRDLDVGDVTGELAIREKLQCKPFKWFLDNVASGIVDVYPPFPEPDYANGTIRSVKTGLCLDTAGINRGNITLYPCSGGPRQRFAWSWRQTIHVPNGQFCLEATKSNTLAPKITNCNSVWMPRHQKWRFNPHSGLLWGLANNLCLEGSHNRDLKMTTCSKYNVKQHFQFQRVNYDQINKDFPDMN